MTQNTVRVKVRCHSCRTVAQLTPEHYRALVKGEELALSCPKCNHQFTFSAMGPARQAQPVAVSAEVDVPPPAPPPAPAPEYPPPPFAPLRLAEAAHAPANVPSPAFPLLHAETSDTSPAAPPLSPYPAPAIGDRRERAQTANSGKPSLSFNERWKRLPSWVQWLVVGVMILVLAVIIIALPSGGSGDAPKNQPNQTTTPDTNPAPADVRTPQGQMP